MTDAILHPLRDNQRAAVAPDRDIWLSASAGTGKTQVLTARVFRLLLGGSAPENLLCLTFTKAGAAEMANRINARLAAWVRMKPDLLATDLKAIGAPFGPEDQARARRLFAKVLDAPGGGLRIQTIHSFCQTLLAAFPAEAGLVPGFVPLEERDQLQLRREVLADLVADAAGDGRGWLIEAVQALSVRLGEQGAEAFLVRCASAPDAMALVPDSVEGAEVFARRIAGVQIEGDPGEWLADQCSDGAIDRDLLRGIREHNAGWKAATGATNVEKIDRWLALAPADRGAQLAELNSVWATQKGGLTKSAPKGDGYAEAAQAMLDWCARLRSQVALARFAELYAAALSAGKAYATAYALAKHRGAVVDFDDLIRRAARLLKQPGIGDWIRFKLDARIDHVLVDEAQDTNRAQWDIIEAVTEDFFTGLGAREGRLRTVFTVGDFKQAIFGFQGTDPGQYRAARERLHERIERAYADPDLGDIGPRTLQRLDLDTSFRSTEPILKLVDSLLAERSFGAFGLEAPVASHIGVKPDVGEVLLLRPVRPIDDSAAEEDEESWLAEEKLNYAKKLARQIKDWIDEKRVLATTGKPLAAGDIMILVRRRSELAALLVARLYAEGVPVAGVDRLRLGQPLAVKDLLAAIRFAVQPEDDLNLAELLVSPLIGWSQEQLLKAAYRTGDERGLSLWRHLRGQERLAEAIHPLRDLLARAEYGTPHEFLERILSGEMDGRRRLVARLGHEALDPIGELINAAFLFEQNHNASLQGFLDWFDRGDVDVKREQARASGEVRVMTVHGSKGLQAPLVILADTTADPTRTPDRSFDLPMKDERGQRTGVDIPVLALRKEEKSGQLAEVAEKEAVRGLEEHWRLLYVALTRAEERLVLAGSLGVRAKKPPEHSWYAALDRSLDAMGCEWEEHEEWGAVRRFAGSDVAKEKLGDKKGQLPPTAPPDWLRAPAPVEARPPRPLAPSSGGEDDTSAAPPDPELRAAAERGRLLHGLFEHLPGAASEQRRELGLAWLQRRAPELDEAARMELIERASLVLDDPRWKAIFAPDALAEAPIAAVVGEIVIAGTVDRLLIGRDHILVVDFKTGTHVPLDAAAVPIAYQRQMARYVAALGTIFPGRPVRAALLYSHAPRLIELTAMQLEANSPA
ncbi:double-strand break repair helicase AddA [Novosphingopyxis sp.]|uniref:double-strand break repair helicase AddA n=1 Tax=Novosphingopyxis sp. TaxID=2709690 RepID=UPI003B5C81B0